MGVFFGLGIGLVILALAGLGRAVAPWAVWLTFTVGVLSLITGAARMDSRGQRMLAPVVFFVLVALLWIFELSTGVVPWFTWLSFVAGLIYLGGMLITESPRWGHHEPLRGPRPVTP
jgi:hypothetical protein